MVGLLPRLSVHALTQKAASFEAALLLNSQIRNIQIREFNYLLLLRRGSGARHLLAIVFDESLQVAVAPLCVEVVVLHLRVNLVIFPVVHVVAIDRAHDSGAMASTRAV